MNMMTIYDRLPIILQNAAVSLEGLKIRKTRYNASFERKVEEYDKRKSWSYQELCEFRDEKLRRLVKHAYDTVPFYQLTFTERKLRPSDIKTIDDLHKLPIIDKEVIKANPKLFMSTKADDYKCIHAHTSGSTGEGFQFTTTLECMQEQFAAYNSAYHLYGVTLNTWKAHFSGQRIVPANQKNPPYWRTMHPDKRLLLSAYHMKDETLRSYIDEINKREIIWIQGYPSLIYTLAGFMLRNNIRFNHEIKLVSLGSENLLESQRQVIKKAFNLNPLNIYGQTESVAIFTGRQNGEMFVDEDFSAVEFVDNAYGGKNVVGTNLYNYAMPFIRYKTNDIVEVSPTMENNRRKILSIDGRFEDYVCTKNGVKLGRLDHLFKDTRFIKEAQIYQREDYSIIIYVVGNPLLCAEDEKTVLAVLKEMTAENLNVTFEYVNEIPKTSTGKLRFVISEVK